jgi:hypothetical protein
MTSNPFDKHRQQPASGPTSESLRAWCDENNRKKLTERMGRWYFVVKVDGVEKVDTLDGADGANVHKLLNGVLEDFAGWPANRMEGYRRWLWDCAQAGLVEAIRPQLEPVA